MPGWWTNLATYNKLLDAVVAEYGDQCWLCHEPIDLALPRRHPWGLSLDHVIPRSQGGPDSIENLRPAHLRCNMRRGNRRPHTVRRSTLHPLLTGQPATDQPRRVVLIAGPPGSGKTTLAHKLAAAESLEVFDLDDSRWNHNHRLFGYALDQLRTNPRARAVVIRSGATRSARAKAARQIDATETTILTTPLAECEARILARRRGRDLDHQLAAARQWWTDFEPEPAAAFPTTPTETSPPSSDFSPNHPEKNR